jgi:hypothetical protein
MVGNQLLVRGLKGPFIFKAMITGKKVFSNKPVDGDNNNSI